MGIDTEKFGHAKRIVAQHLKIAKDYPTRYEVRFIGRLPFDKGWNHEYDFDKTKDQHLDKAEHAYFGIFFRRSQAPHQATLAIGQDSKRLSGLDLRIVPIVNPSALVFEELWNEWSIETNPFAGDHFDGSKLKERPALFAYS